jgi:hypothetical protein
MFAAAQRNLEAESVLDMTHFKCKFWKQIDVCTHQSPLIFRIPLYVVPLPFCILVDTNARAHSQ